MLPVAAQLSGEVALQAQREILHEQQRRAQVVRDGIGEGFQILVGHREFLGALRLEYLQRGVLVAQALQVERARDHRQPPRSGGMGLVM